MVQRLTAWSAPSWWTVRVANVVYFLKLRITLCSPPRLSYSTLYSFSCREVEELSVETCQASTIFLLSLHAGRMTVCHKPDALSARNTKSGIAEIELREREIPLFIFICKGLYIATFIVQNDGFTVRA